MVTMIATLAVDTPGATCPAAVVRLGSAGWALSGLSGVDSERAELAVVDPELLDHCVGVGKGVDVGSAEPIDPVGDDGAGGLGGDGV
jgi:hypothetical protein